MLTATYMYKENEDSLHKLAVKSTLTNVTGMFGSEILQIFGRGLILKCYILYVSTHIMIYVYSYCVYITHH